MGRFSATPWRHGTPGHGKDDIFLAPPGTTVGLLFPRAGQFKSEGGFATFTVVGFFKSGMSEYDSTHVYVPLDRLQDQRLLIDARGRGAVNQIQIRVKPGVNLDNMAEKIQDALNGRASARVFPRRDPGKGSIKDPLLPVPSPSSRASSTSSCSSSSQWPDSASWPSSR